MIDIDTLEKIIIEEEETRLACAKIEFAIEVIMAIRFLKSTAGANKESVMILSGGCSRDRRFFEDEEVNRYIHFVGKIKKISFETFDESISPDFRMKEVLSRDKKARESYDYFGGKKIELTPLYIKFDKNWTI